MRLADSFPSWMLGALLLVSGCKPDIGDACNLHSDCSTAGNRICDPTFPSGYCTIFNCSPDKCPDEALCVAYGTALSTVPECADPAGGRLERTFCMKACGGDSDCRSGYDCVDLEDPEQNPWGAVVVDRRTSRHRVCTVEVKNASDAAPGSTAICNPPLDASFPPEPDGAVPAEAGRDAAADARAEAATDAPSDGRADGGADAGRDAAVEAAPDASVQDGSPAPDASEASTDAAPDVKDAQGGS